MAAIRWRLPRFWLAAVPALGLAACAVTPPAPAPGPEPPEGLPVAAPAAGSGSPATTVHWDGRWIVYDGEFSEEANAQARRLFMEHPDAAGLRVTSNGGSIQHGMALGEWLLVTGRDVYIEGYCFSSCANYVFPAGRRKIVSGAAIIGWHGGTRQWPSAEAMCVDQREAVRWDAAQRADCIAIAQAARDREERFYALLEVDMEVMVYGLRPGANYPSRDTDVAWTYDADGLAHFGIREVYVDGEAWTPLLEIDGQTVCLMDLASGRCGPAPPRR